ncbi:MAG: hypothetical protein GX772_10860 [Alcaligenaceae bacterium]|nr:hypothetical protein [Alcaligenaceae bacterium]
MNDRTLHVRVGEHAQVSLAQAAEAMKAVERGEAVDPHFEVSFADIGQMFAVFTPRRWELLAALREAGPMSISALAKLLKRDYKNVHGDVTALIEWMAIERDEGGLIHAPYADIAVGVHLPDRRVA